MAYSGSPFRSSRTRTRRHGLWLVLLVSVIFVTFLVSRFPSDGIRRGICGAAPRAAGTPAEPYTQRYLLWHGIDTGTERTDPASIAGRYAAVVLNSFQGDFARRLRALDSDVRLYVYVDLSSVRHYDGDKALVTGVSYGEALRQGWLARDDGGRPIEWRGYDGHLQAAVWEPAYQSAWTKGAVALASEGPWDGVFADNDLMTLDYYTDAVPLPASGAEQRDILLRRALTQLVTAAGKSLNAAGKQFFTNLGDSRLRLGDVAAHGAYGGIMEEMFVSWSRDGSPDIADTEPTLWSAQVKMLGLPRHSWAQTQAAPGDHRTQLYGYGSFLLGARAGDAWATTTDSSEPPPMPPETRIDLRLPTAPATEFGGVWTRAFEGGWVAVNPQAHRSAVVTPPPGLVDVRGCAAGEKSLEPMSAVVLARDKSP